MMMNMIVSAAAVAFAGAINAAEASADTHAAEAGAQFERLIIEYVARYARTPAT
jgi:hypothetical protein